MKNNILIIDDDKSIIDLIDIYLKNEGYNVYTALSGEDGLVILKEQNIDLVVLDIMMTGIDGLEVCKKIRKNDNIPIIFLSAKSEDMDKIMGLGIGADDYMTKPFNPMELIARIKSQLRRYLHFNQSTQANKKNLIRINGLTINTESRMVKIWDKTIELTPTEYGILLLLANNMGRVLSSEEIFEGVWKEKYFESNNTVMVHMWRLREKIEAIPKKPTIIETVWGVGYKIEKKD